jgi:hypothetical protein
MNNNLFKTIIWASAAVIAMAACSSNNDEPLTPQLRMLTINDAAITRATLNDAGKTLPAAWTEGDKITVKNLSVDDDAKTTLEKKGGNTFSGGYISCIDSHHLAVLYPPASISYYNEYTITLSGQDGTLETIANKYHYLYGLATVESSTNTTATASMTQFLQPLLCVCRFSFYTGDDKTNLLKVTSLKIGFHEQGQGGSSGSYPETATVTLKLANNGSTQVVSPSTSSTSSTSPLSISLDSPSENVYVALLPLPFDSSTGARSYQFTVTDNNGKSFIGYAQAKLKDGMFFPAVLKVQEQ